METRGRARAARSNSQVSRVRTRAQAAAEAAAAAASTNTPPSTSARSSSTVPVATVTPRGGRKRSRPIRKSTSSELESGASVNKPSEARTEPTGSSVRPPKRVRRVPSVSRGGRLPSSGARSRTGVVGRGTTSGSPVSSRGRSASSRGRARRASRGGHRGSLLRTRMNDDEGFPNAEAPNSGSDRAGTATLHGLLRTLGAGLDEMFPIPHSSSSSRVRAILNSLRTTNSNPAKLEALTDLCEYLSVGTEDSMISFSVEAFVPPLVGLLSDGTPDLKLLSARAITHLMDALPSAASSLSRQGASIPLCANLLSIQYIDLAEQSLSALEKLSVDFPHPIVRAGGFSAALSFIDFFSTGVQRVAASIISNLCRSPPGDVMDVVIEVLPAMFRLLDSEDQRIREHTVQAFSRLADALRGNSLKLEQLCSEKEILVEKVLGLIVPASPPALSPTCFSAAIHLLSTLARGSVALSLKLMNTTSLVFKMEEHLKMVESSHAMDFLSLADALLPESGDRDDVVMSFPRSRRRRNSSGSTAIASVDLARREALTNDPPSLSPFARTLFQPLMHFFVSSADISSRNLVLSILCKVLSFASQPLVESLISANLSEGKSHATDVSFCPFVATLLGQNSSPAEVSLGLLLVNSALQKVPRVRENFLREGVLHELFRLAGHEVFVVAHGRNSNFSSPNSGDINCGGGAVETIRNLRRGTSFEGVRRTSRSSVIKHNLSRSINTESVKSDVLKGTQSAPQNTQAISARALRIVNQHMKSSEVDIPCLTEMRSPVLSDLVEIHDALMSACNDETTTAGYKLLVKLMQKLTAATSVTVFEFSCSSIADALHEYLICSPSTEKIQIERFISFSSSLRKYASKNAFASLFRLLNGSLSAEENLTVHLSHAPSIAPGSSLNWGLRQLSQPFKLKLCRTDPMKSSNGLRDYSAHVVLIEPLATMASVEDFLWPRVCLEDNPRKSQSNLRRGSHSHGERNNYGSESHSIAELNNYSANEESSDAKRSNEGGEQVGSSRTREVLMGPLDGEIFGAHRTTDGVDHIESEAGVDLTAIHDTSRRARTNVNSEEDLSSGSDSEYVIERDDDADDDIGRDDPEFGINQELSGSLPPVELDHESLSNMPNRMAIRLSDEYSVGGVGLRYEGIRRSRRSPVMTRSYANGSVSASALRSYATALTGPGRSVHQSNRARRPGKHSNNRRSDTQRLQFSINNIPVSLNSSILSAVVRSSIHLDSGISSNIWNETHALNYSKASTISSSRTVPANSGGPSNIVPSLRRSSRLRHSAGREKPQSTGSSSMNPGDVNSQFSPSLSAFVRVPKFSCFSHLPGRLSKYISLLAYLKWLYFNSNVTVRGEIAPLSYPFDFGETPEFTNQKVTLKVKRQVADPLALCANAFPFWCFSIARYASFLIPFETRRILFQSTALGVARGLYLLQGREDLANRGNDFRNNLLRNTRSDRDTRIGRIQRQKVRIHRSRLLESAIRVMALYGNHSTVLEVEYFDEVGTGLGPTLEFYTSTSREVQKWGLNIWVAKNNSVQDSEHISHRTSSKSLDLELSRMDFVEPCGDGLFPSVLSKKESGSLTLDYFKFIGRLVAKALADGRLLDLRFSRIFYELLLTYASLLEAYDTWAMHNNEVNGYFHSIGRGDSAKIAANVKSLDAKNIWEVFRSGRAPLDILKSVDPQLASSLLKLLDMISSGEADTISSLCLSFTLPGDDCIELVPNGRDIAVTAKNLEEYVARITYFVLFGGVRDQSEAFIVGFSDVLDLRSLTLLQAHELELLICGPMYERWSVEFLVQSTRCDHGFRHESRAVLTLFKVLSELKPQEQRQFVQFVTGSPALPLGGLCNLKPRLTIVKRTPEGDRSPDDCLPTVMTCTNYLKLPDYSNYEVARERIMYAIEEGQGSFHLS